MKHRLKTLPIFFIYLLSFAQTPILPPKEKSIQTYRRYFSIETNRSYLKKSTKTVSECISLLEKDGVFSDLREAQNEMLSKKWVKSTSYPIQLKIAPTIDEAFNRLYKIANEYSGKAIDITSLTPLQLKLLKGFINYGDIESNRGASSSRFHASCFSIPTAAINSYFSLLDLMDTIEEKNSLNPLVARANKTLKEIGMQSWTKPIRNDSTDNNVVQVERFRNHVWWVGGNALAYRSVFPAAIMLRSTAMVDVLAEVSQKALSSVSQNTYDTAFWREGFTEDGAGWGHRKQSLVWGYPIDGTNSALQLLQQLKNSPWQIKLTKQNKQAIFNYLRGSSWYAYKGYIPVCTSRANMKYTPEKIQIKSTLLIDNLLKNWATSFSTMEIGELKQLQHEVKNYNISMHSYTQGTYSGSRYFFNNDDLIQKTNSHYTLVNMASSRVDGNESALFADRYNYFTDDGLTLFEKKGDEYNKSIGAWNLTAIPGVTSRQGQDNLKPSTNWNGYSSKYNFAGATTNGSKNAVAGYIFEKRNQSSKKHNNPYIYNVKAYKSYFFMENYMIALGAGITNLNPALKGDIYTTIDQTYWDDKLKWAGTTKNGCLANKNHSTQIKLSCKNDQIIWAQQKNGFAYGIFPKHTDGEVLLNAETRVSKWNELNPINKKIKNLPKEIPVFQLSINHGKNIENGKYAYFVYLENNFSTKKMSNPNFVILSNTRSIQAMSTKDERVISAVFYDDKQKLHTKRGLVQVSAPAIVLLEEHDSYWSICVTDPHMNPELKSIDLFTTINLRNPHKSSLIRPEKLTIQLSKDAKLGKPVIYKINKL